jgi:hypothetical protein
MTIEIPVWLLWLLAIVVGVPVVIAIVIAAVVGFAFIVNFDGLKW